MSRELTAAQETKLLNDLNLGEEIARHPRFKNVFATKSGLVLGIKTYLKNPVAFIRKSTSSNVTGYEQVTFAREDGRRYEYTHRVVLETFVPCPDENEDWVVDHINSVRDDNRLENLQWLTRRENIQKRDDEGKLNKKTYIYDTVEDTITAYDSRIEAAESINMFRSIMTKYIKLGQLVRKRYFISDDIMTMNTAKDLYKAKLNYITFVYDVVTDEVSEYVDRAEACKAIELSQISNLTSAIRYGHIIKKRYYVTDYPLTKEEYEDIFDAREVRRLRREAKLNKVGK